MHKERIQTYKKDDGQITIEEFYSPFGRLDKHNRWVRIAEIIPWQHYEKKYAERFCDNNGAPAIKFRMAMGTLIIKQRTGHSDEEVIQDIVENPYMQYLIGLHEFTTAAPFSQSSITNFRKYITPEMVNEINDELFRGSRWKGGDKDGNSGGAPSEGDGPGLPAANKGTLQLDATCAPAYIAYPTDINLLNQAREELEAMVDTLHPLTGNQRKPRTYRKVARRDYLRFIKKRKPRMKEIRKAIGQQLRYVRRNLSHVDQLIGQVEEEGLARRQRYRLATIRELYRQQLKMFETRSHTVENRIVSIGQPHVRPIVRGKVNAPVEFGAKISASLVDGYAFIDKLSWDAYNEEAILIPAVETYKKRHGHYPEAVLADKIYRNRDNLSYCKKRGIRLSGPRLGRPPRETDKETIHRARADASERNMIEGKFGEGKSCYGLDRIMARLKESSETVIALTFLCLNISRRLRVLLCRFLHALICWIEEQYLMKFVVFG